MDTSERRHFEFSRFIVTRGNKSSAMLGRPTVASRDAKTNCIEEQTWI